RFSRDWSSDVCSSDLTPHGALLAFPTSLLAFLLSPFPWQAVGGSMRLKLALVDVALWWWMIPKVLVGLREAWRKQRESVGLMIQIGRASCRERGEVRG